MPSRTRTRFKTKRTWKSPSASQPIPVTRPSAKHKRYADFPVTPLSTYSALYDPERPFAERVCAAWLERGVDATTHERRSPSVSINRLGREGARAVAVLSRLSRRAAPPAAANKATISGADAESPSAHSIDSISIIVAMFIIGIIKKHTDVRRARCTRIRARMRVTAAASAGTTSTLCK